MIIGALGLLLVGFGLLIAAVLTGSEVYSYVAMVVSVVGLVLVVVDAVRGRGRRRAGREAAGGERAGDHAEVTDPDPRG